MLRCARFVAAGQQAFFRDGPRALRPMYMTEAAQALDVHLSTVSRAVKDKYLQCRQGVFPLSYFFSAPGPGRQRCQPPGGAVAAAGADRRGGQGPPPVG